MHTIDIACAAKLAVSILLYKVLAIIHHNTNFCCRDGLVHTEMTNTMLELKQWYGVYEQADEI